MAATLIILGLCAMGLTAHWAAARWVAQRRADRAAAVQRLPSATGDLRTHLISEVDYLECSEDCPGCHRLSREARLFLQILLPQLRVLTNRVGADLDAKCDARVVEIATPLPGLHLVAQDERDVDAAATAAGWRLKRLPMSEVGLQQWNVHLSSSQDAAEGEGRAERERRPG
jgi:hypothetical protein